MLINFFFELHEGKVPNYPASHGCVRLPSKFAKSLFRDTKTGVHVIITDRPVSLRFVQHPALFQPRDVIFAVAGDVNWDALQGEVERLFGDWKPLDRPAVKVAAHTPESAHIDKDLDQTQISLAYPSVPIGCHVKRPLSRRSPATSKKATAVASFEPAMLMPIDAWASTAPALAGSPGRARTSTPRVPSNVFFIVPDPAQPVAIFAHGG